MNPIVLMSQLLDKAKSWNGRNVPEISETLVEDWAEFLQLQRFPARLWGDAIRLWASDADAPFLSVGVLQRYAYRVRDEWERDPARRGELEVRREVTIAENRRKATQRVLERRKHATQAIPQGRQENRRETPIRAKLSNLRPNPRQLLAQLNQENPEPCPTQDTPPTP